MAKCYTFTGSPAQTQRLKVNHGVLNLIRSGKEPDPQKVFNAYTGKGGLHGLRYDDFGSRYEYTEAKRRFEQGQFFTPDKVVRVISDFLQVPSGSRVTDPTCGAGAFANHFRAANFNGLEIDSDAVTVARYLYPWADIAEGDLRAWQPSMKADFVVGNPPFKLRWSVPDCPMANDAGEAASEDVFLWRASQALSAGGSVCFVAPASWLTDDLTCAKALAFISQRFERVAEVLLPSAIFEDVGVEEFGTKIVLLRAWLPSETPAATAPAIVDGRCLSEPEILAAWQDACPAYIVFRAGLAAKRASLAFADQRGGRPERAEQTARHYRFLRLLAELRRQDGAAAGALAEAWAQANAPAKYDRDGNRLPQPEPAQVVKNARRALRRLSKPDRHLVRIVRTARGVEVMTFSRAAALAVSSARFTVTNAELAAGDVPIAELRRKIDAVAAAVRARNERRLEKDEDAAVVVFESLNVFRIARRLQRRFGLWTRPLSVDAPELRRLREDVADYYRAHASKGVRVYDKQVDRLARLCAKPGGFNAWDMGVGKSLAGLAWDAVKRREDQQRGRKCANGWTLIVSSALAVELHWEGQLSHYSIPFRRPNTRSEWLATPERGTFDQAVLLATHHQIATHARAIRTLVRRGLIRAVIVDESDEFSGRGSKRANGLRVACREIRHKQFLTGTPVRNNASELFSQLEVLLHGEPFFRCVAPRQIVYDREVREFVETPNPDYLTPYIGRGAFALFKRSHAPARPTVMGADRTISTLPNRAELEEFLNCFRSRLRLEELIEKVPFERETVPVDLGPTERACYDAMARSATAVARAFLAVSISDRRAQLLSLAQAIRLLQQTASMPNKFGFAGQGAKERHLIDTIRASSASHVAVGVIWRESVERLLPVLQREFPDRTVIAFDGEDSFSSRRRKLAELSAASRGLLLCTQQSVRSSLNLPIVSEVIAESLPWNFTALNQWAMRFCRLTSTKCVHVKLLVAEGTIEERILGLLLRKEAVARPIAGDDIEDEEALFGEYGIGAADLGELAQYLAQADPALRSAA